MSSSHDHIRVWTATLFAAEEIPSAMVTFVSLLMFLQMRTPVWESTLLAALLFVPWVMKSWVRSYVRRAGHYRRFIQIDEALLTIALGALAFTLPHGRMWTFACLLVVSLLCAWHELLARTYYERMLRPAEQESHRGIKILASQMAVVLTYGLLIMSVGVLQIYFRQKSASYSWSLGCYLVTGVLLLFTLLHIIILERPFSEDSMSANSVSGSLKAEYRVIERIRQRPMWWRDVLTLFLMLLPQSLMFYTRTIFFLDKSARGGLGCTLQEVGFAQGTIGVIAFLFGISAGLWLRNNLGEDKVRWPMTIALGLSPLLYLIMSYSHPDNLASLCIYTFQAQLLFGFGLNACLEYVRHISGERYRNTVYILYIPIISLCMIIPLALSGLILEHMDYRTYYLIDTLTAPLGWLIIRGIHNAQCIINNS